MTEVWEDGQLEPELLPNIEGKCSRALLQIAAAMPRTGTAPPVMSVAGSAIPDVQERPEFAIS